MNSYFKQLIISLSALLSASVPAAAADIITTAPEGKTVEYYADFQNYDNLFDFVGDYHTVQRLVFTDNGDVYIPNLLLRRTMPAYIQGVYDKDAATITVPAGQWVFFFPNVKIPACLYLLDADGNAGPTASEFYTEPLVFDVSDDGVLTLRATEKFPMFGICNGNASNEVYQNARDLRFTPVANVADKMLNFDYSYGYNDEATVRTTTASGYREGNDIIWIKGFDPKYPDSWIRLDRGGDSFVAQSFQVVHYFSDENPIVCAATDGENFLRALPVTVDESSMIITAATDGISFSEATNDGNDSAVLYNSYVNIRLEQRTFSALVPAAPEFVSYSEPNSAGETEFIFSAEPTSTGGEPLLKDYLAYRLYIDGVHYVFTPKDYRWINTDMAEVPYSFDNYNFFSRGSGNERRYVYFNKLPSDVSTIAVEQVYDFDGVKSVSDRLIYDIASGTAHTSAGIENVEADDCTAESVYYNLQGVRVEQPTYGRVYIRVNGTKASKIIL